MKNNEGKQFLGEPTSMLSCFKLGDFEENYLLEENNLELWELATLA
jgi:hypothetical protein